jgi:hypothetical protein
VTDEDRARARALIVSSATGKGRRDVKLVIDFLCDTIAARLQEQSDAYFTRDIVDGDEVAYSFDDARDFVQRLPLPEKET